MKLNILYSGELMRWATLRYSTDETETKTVVKSSFPKECWSEDGSNVKTDAIHTVKCVCRQQRRDHDTASRACDN